MKPRVVFFAPPSITPLDLIGPMQVFQAAEACGVHYRILVCGANDSLPVGGNLRFADLAPYEDVVVCSEDIVFIAGFWGKSPLSPRFKTKHANLFQWIREAKASRALLCSVCTGAFLLAEAGVLDGIPCTTHWEDADRLQKTYPQIKVKKEVLFVGADNVFTSAGVASGIDLALHILASRHGPRLAFEVARRLVVYLRRSGAETQESIYLQYRNHLDDMVHRTQDLLVETLDAPLPREELARQVGSSSRNLSRRFRQSIGVSIGEYIKQLRLERARSLLGQDGSKVDDVARACGLGGARQLRNLYHQNHKHSPRS